MNPPKIAQVAAFIAIFSIYAAVRLWNLTTSCLWFDEIFSVHAAEHSWGSILNFVALDLIHPPLFYALLKLWIAVGGESLSWLRTFPVLLSILAIGPFVLLCRELKLGNWTTVIALFLIAVNGSLIKYAQEVRMYSLLMCLSLFSMWLFLRFFRTGKSFMALTVVNILLVYTHYFGWLVILSEIVVILLIHRVKLRAVLLMTAVTIVSFTPWLFAIVSAARSGSELGQNIGWMQRPGPGQIAQLVLNLIEPFYFSAMSIDPFSIYRVSIPILLLFIAVQTLFYAKIKSFERDKWTNVKLLIMFVLVPTIAAFAGSWLLPYSIWGTRHLVIVFTPVSILIACAIVNLEFGKIRKFVITLLILFTGYAFFIQARRATETPIWCGFEPLAREMHAANRAPIYVFEDLAAYHLWFAFRNDGYPPEVIKIEKLQGMSEDRAYFLPRGFDKVPKVEPARFEYDQMWLLYRAREFDASEPPIDTITRQGYEIEEHELYDYGYQKLIGVLLRRKG